ncbi:hypothetical protein ACWD0J_20715 [Streptomyces sp. NPDC003011]
MDSIDPSRWDLLDDLIAAATASPPPAPNHWRFATTPPSHSTSATFSVAPTTSHLGQQRWARDTRPGAHCLHRAVSLDSSVPHVSPMDPDIAQQHVESLTLRARIAADIDIDDLGRAMGFAHDYDFLGNTRQRFGRYSAPVVRDSGWAHDPHSFRALTPGERRLHSHSLDRLGDALAGYGAIEGHGEHRHIVTDYGYVMVGAPGSSAGGSSAGLLDLFWASPEIEPFRRWSIASDHRPGGDA